MARLFFGFILTLFCTGGITNSSPETPIGGLMLLTVSAFIGVALMYSGAKSLQ